MEETRMRVQTGEYEWDVEIWLIISEILPTATIQRTGVNFTVSSTEELIQVCEAVKESGRDVTYSHHPDDSPP